MLKNLKNKIEEISKKAKETLENTSAKASDTIKENIPNDILDNVSDIANKTKRVAQDNLESISDKLLDSGLEQIESYCSWCFEKHKCTLKEKSNLTRNIYICCGCGHEIVKCRVCNNKAKYSGIKNENISMWSNNFCAVHEGQIAKFESLNWSLESIGEYRDIVERTEVNYKRIATTTTFTLAGAAVIAPIAFLAAPAIGGAIGSSFLGYSGAVATKAGLASLGGGALASGGLGMAGGVAVVTATGSALGGRYGAVISNSYFGDIDGFEIVKIKLGIEPAIICIDGFLNEKNRKAPQSWLDGLEEKYKENTIYYVKWESKRLMKLVASISQVLTKEGLKSTTFSAALSASKATASNVVPLGFAFQTLQFATNPWSVASIKAYQTGALLADIIARTDKEYILIGHSLGARVIYSCLDSLKTKDKYFIKDVHLLGGAVDKNCKNDDNRVCWSELHNSVSGKIRNYYSKNDTVLQTLYKVGEGVKFEFGDPIGRYPIENEKIDNIDVTEDIKGHTEYKPNLNKILQV
ncbi:DUF726 domain-containing protein [Aliarcobacter butzleri]|uniref:DUF726 domain-containing protein n=1 Tax=Aliarcobacter butzleri TaxID=28197 RepID=UPI00344C233D